MEFRSFVIPLLEGLSELKEGQTFSFIYKSTINNYTISSFMSNKYYRETKATMMTELNRLIEKVESISTDIDTKTINDVISVIESSLPSFEILKDNYEEDNESKDFISNIRTRLEETLPKLKNMLTLTKSNTTDEEKTDVIGVDDQIQVSILSVQGSLPSLIPSNTKDTNSIISSIIPPANINQEENKHKETKQDEDIKKNAQIKSTVFSSHRLYKHPYRKRYVNQGIRIMNNVDCYSNRTRTESLYDCTCPCDF